MNVPFDGDTCCGSRRADVTTASTRTGAAQLQPAVAPQGGVRGAPPCAMVTHDLRGVLLLRHGNTWWRAARLAASLDAFGVGTRAESIERVTAGAAAVQSLQYHGRVYNAFCTGGEQPFMSVSASRTRSGTRRSPP